LSFSVLYQSTIINMQSSIVHYLAVAVIAAAFSSCRKDDVPVIDLQLSQTTAVLAPGETKTLSVSMTPARAAGKTPEWNSSAPSVAKVANGVVTAVSDGTAEISVTVENARAAATCRITVSSKQITMMTQILGNVTVELAGTGIIAIDWGDGTESTTVSLSENTSAYTHGYRDAVQRTVTITGDHITHLHCGNNGITRLGLSKYPALKELICFYNQLTELDVSKNTELTLLWCNGNQLASLDVSNNTALKYLSCRNNRLTDLDVSNHTALATLYCYDNLLTSLSVNACAELVELNCSNNQMRSLNLQGCTALKELNCKINRLISLDVTDNTELTSLSCDINRITNLDVSNNRELTLLSCEFNRLTNLDISNNTRLVSLSCADNDLRELDASHNTALQSLSCQSNALSGSEIDKMFGTLHSAVLPGKIVYIGYNPGTDDCDYSIATDKGWEVTDN
jgi:hypothetical protein